ncbi:MAG: D-alanine--D-alanine ligase [Candidatus Omnitrophica bacterium]|nr:D-alanine--D-alanine ligase [Candidatus Omnitrophota bacterium]
MNPPRKVAVIMGGPSEEHDVSLNSGTGVVEALTRRHWVVEPVVIPKTVTPVKACALVKRAIHQIGPDVVFIALHGAFGEDGTIQQLCEDCHVPYTGSDARASRLGMDKAASRRRFEAAGLSVPRWKTVTLARRAAGTAQGRMTSDAPALDSFTYPVVVKPINQGSSLGVSIVQAEDHLAPALAAAGRYGPHVVIEEFIAGRELTVGILGEEPLPIIEIRPRQPFFDYAAKYTKGLTEYLVPAELPAEMAQAVEASALTAHRALGCRHLSRVDLILDHREVPVILEVNTIPGFTPTSLLPKAAACVHLSYDELCEQVVMMAAPSLQGAWRSTSDLAHVSVP